MFLRKNVTLTIFIFIICFLNIEAQTPAKEKPKKFKGEMYIYWGYNRGWYTNSDIRFKGNQYDFVLSDVVAKDRPSQIAFDPYLKPDRLSIPQSNFRLGYFFADHWSISLGQDHMKYVMTQNQQVKINGYIKDSESGYSNIYFKDAITLKEDFLIFEHTDGLNYINVELRRMDNGIQLSKYGLSNIDVNFIEGLGGGVMFPRTNCTLLGNERYDEFHISGYGLSAVAGINITFWDCIFLQSEIKGGFINMPDIRTTYNEIDRASQQFLYTEYLILIGAKFRLKNFPVKK